MCSSFPPCATLRQLIELKESDPAKFAAYAQMAVDAAKLAEEQPDAFNQLIQEVAAGAYHTDFRNGHPFCHTPTRALLLKERLERTTEEALLVQAACSYLKQHASL